MTFENLLAVLHRDGGHFAEEHGLDRAAEVAVEQFYRDQRELEELRRWRARDPSVRSITWGEIREATESTWGALDLAEKLVLLGFFIEDFPGR